MPRMEHMTAAQRKKVLASAHSPAARQKAVETHAALNAARVELATQFGMKSVDFARPNLLRTIAEKRIPLSAIPEILFRPFSASERRALLAKREANGHASFKGAGGGIGIPLDAIPEKRTNAAHAEGKPRGPYSSNRGHPNAELIGKVIDLLARPDLPNHVVDRLANVLDKLIA